MITLLLFMVVCSDPNGLVLNAFGNPPEIIENECEMLADPEMRDDLYMEFKLQQGYSYFHVLQGYYLCDRWDFSPRKINGTIYVPWLRPYSWVADLNCDGQTNLADLAILLEGFPGGLYKPKPEPEPESKPEPMSIELKAMILKLLMDE